MEAEVVRLRRKIDEFEEKDMGRRLQRKRARQNRERKRRMELEIRQRVRIEERERVRKEIIKEKNSGDTSRLGRLMMLILNYNHNI